MVHRFDTLEIGERARDRRNELRLKQHEAAVLLGWEQPKVSRFEHGRGVTAGACEDIARCYDVSLDWLMVGKEAPEDRVSRVSVEEAIKTTCEQVEYLLYERLPLLDSLLLEQEETREEMERYIQETTGITGAGDCLQTYVIDAGSKDALIRYHKELDRKAAHQLQPTNYALLDEI